MSHHKVGKHKVIAREGWELVALVNELTGRLCDEQEQYADIRPIGPIDC